MRAWPGSRARCGASGGCSRRTPIASTSSRAVGLGLLDDHVRHCVKESLVAGDGEDKITELVAAVERFATR